MRRCYSDRRRRCCRPPLRVHVGDQPYVVKQMAYESGTDDWCDRLFWDEEPGCGCEPPWMEDDFPPFFPPGPGGPPPFPFDGEARMDEEPAQEHSGELMPSEFHPEPGFHPPFHRRRYNCDGCNMKIKVFKYDACRKAQSGVIVGLFERGRLIRTAETNDRGEAVFSYLYPGMYTVQELEVPSGVEEDTTRFAVHLNRSCTSAIVVFKQGRCRHDCPDNSRWWPQNSHHS